MMFNLQAAQAGAQSFGILPGDPRYPTKPVYSWDFERLSFRVVWLAPGQAYVPASLMNFFGDPA